ncbi:MAG TPA: AIR synthase [Clostridiaceae bacterium]|nr:AIR synthase [Clostridiaceae bacterium]
MKIGKIPNNTLKKIILDKITNKRCEVLIRPKIGEDCSALDFGEDACVLSCDPITGASNEVGRLAVHISCNDIASCGVEPIGLMVALLAPPEATEKELETIMRQLCETASSLNVDIIGGHTEITDSVNKFILITTAIGKGSKDKLIKTSDAKPGDDIIITKTAGIEGTAIISHDKEAELSEKLGKDLIESGKAFINNISVVKEGIIASKFGVNAMHDITEGGVLGAVWEIAEASGTGCIIEADKIPVADVTKIICDYYKIDPLKLISSGSMLITCSNGQALVEELANNGISSAIIGKITKDLTKYIVKDSQLIEIGQPETDELYKVVAL